MSIFRVKEKPAAKALTRKEIALDALGDISRQLQKTSTVKRPGAYEYDEQVRKLISITLTTIQRVERVPDGEDQDARVFHHIFVYSSLFYHWSEEALGKVKAPGDMMAIAEAKRMVRELKLAVRV